MRDIKSKIYIGILELIDQQIFPLTVPEMSLTSQGKQIKNSTP